jgi:hypothetical protein
VLRQTRRSSSAVGLAGLREVLFPVIEKKHGFKVLFEGTNSLINLRRSRPTRPSDHDGHHDERSGADPRERD